MRPDLQPPGPSGPGGWHPKYTFKYVLKYVFKCVLFDYVSRVCKGGSHLLEQPLREHRSTSGDDGGVEDVAGEHKGNDEPVVLAQESE